MRRVSQSKLMKERNVRRCRLSLLLLLLFEGDIRLKPLVHGN